MNSSYTYFSKVLNKHATAKAFACCACLFEQQGNIIKNAVVFTASVFIFALFLQFPAHSQNKTSNAVNINEQVLPIGSEYQNSIKLLNNRFRVDSDVKEVTLVFFREYGSTPVVLVRPDGSKLFLENDIADESFTWFETDTYDMIALKDPMPGPWQAVGQILPESRVMVIAGITLNAQPIPKIVFSGETLKQTAFLENAGKKVDMTQFRDVVSLSIDFVSSNNPNYPNFGLGSRSVARFEDNGLGFDEKDGDGTFTGQFNLAITQGEWQPVFTVRTPLFSREQVNDKVVLQANPIKISHEVEYNDDKDHLLIIDVDREFVDISSLLVDGNIRHPNGEVVRFDITEITQDAKHINILNNDFGIYKVNMTVFASTVDGRDLVLSVPEYSFVTQAPPIEEPPAVVEDDEQTTEQLIEQEPVEEESSPVLTVLLINLGILLFGGLGIFLVIDKRNKPDNHLTLRAINKLKTIKLKKSKVPADEAEVSKG